MEEELNITDKLLNRIARDTNLISTIILIYAVFSAINFVLSLIVIGMAFSR